MAGVAARAFFQAPIFVIWAFFIFGITCLLVGLVKFSERKDIVWLSLFILALALGMFRHLQKTEIVLREFDSELGQLVEIRGIVDGEPIQKAKSQQLVLKIPEKSGQKVLAVIRPYPKFQYGDEVKARGMIAEPENFSEDFDYRSYLAKDGIFYVMSFPEVERIGVMKGSRLHQWLFALKEAFGFYWRPHSWPAHGDSGRNYRGVPPHRHKSHCRAFRLQHYHCRLLSHALPGQFLFAPVSDFLALGGGYYNVYYAYRCCGFGGAGVSHGFFGADCAKIRQDISHAKRIDVCRRGDDFSQPRHSSL